MLVTFSGIDCSGKSTQIDLLERALAARGLDTATFWLRPGYSRELDQLRSLVRQLAPQKLPTATSTKRRQQAFSATGVTPAWILMALVDLLFQYAVKLRALLAMHDAVICDRFLLDASFDMMLRFGDEIDWRLLLDRVFGSLIPTPDISLLLLIPHRVMLSRMAEKDEPFPDDATIRDRRFELYQDLKSTPCVTPVDASQSPDDVHRIILDLMASRQLIEPEVVE